MPGRAGPGVVADRNRKPVLSARRLLTIGQSTPLRSGSRAGGEWRLGDSSGSIRRSQSTRRRMCEPVPSASSRRAGCRRHRRRRIGGGLRRLRIDGGHRRRGEADASGRHGRLLFLRCRCRRLRRLRLRALGQRLRSTVGGRVLGRCGLRRLRWRHDPGCTRGTVVGVVGQDHACDDLGGGQRHRLRRHHRHVCQRQRRRVCGPHRPGRAGRPRPPRRRTGRPLRRHVRGRARRADHRRGLPEAVPREGMRLRAGLQRRRAATRQHLRRSPQRRHRRGRRRGGLRLRRPGVPVRGPRDLFPRAVCQGRSLDGSYHPNAAGQRDGYVPAVRKAL